MGLDRFRCHSFHPDLDLDSRVRPGQKFVGGTLDQAGIDVQRQRLLRQLKVVTKKAFALILEQRPMCAQEMDKVADLTGRLDQALALCRQGRRGLHEARLRFTGSSLGILAAYKRRQRAAALVENLSIIGTLARTLLRWSLPDHLCSVGRTRIFENRTGT